jgi:hypothetical protein
MRIKNVKVLTAMRAYDEYLEIQTAIVVYEHLKIFIPMYRTLYCALHQDVMQYEDQECGSTYSNEGSWPPTQRANNKDE